MKAPAIPMNRSPTSSEPLHNLAGQPSGNETNHQNDQKTFTRNVHLRIL